MFDDDENNYELWEVKSLSHQRKMVLKDTILSADEPDLENNAECYAELCQFLGDKNLLLVMRDAANDTINNNAELEENQNTKMTPNNLQKNKMTKRGTTFVREVNHNFLPDATKVQCGTKMWRCRSCLQDLNSRCVAVTLEGVQHIPYYTYHTYPQDIFSVRAATNDGGTHNQ